MDASLSNGPQSATISPFTVVRRWQLPHGLAVGVALPAPLTDIPSAALTALHPAECAFAAQQSPRRRVTWVGGRLAMREALRALGIDAGPIFATDRGAPQLPDRVAGSVSHKAGALAVALVDTRGDWQLGVDFELLARPRPGIARKVLTPGEQSRLDGLGPEEHWRAVLLRFSLKEAIYKALDPFVRRYVDFEEVEIDLHTDGTASVTLLLSHNEGPFMVEARAFLAAGEVLTTARVRRE